MESPHPLDIPACKIGCTASKDIQELYSLDSSSGEISAIEKPSPDNGEQGMSFDDWHQIALPDRGILAKRRRHHFDTIVNKPNRSEKWLI
jgi:hypothetical protein